MKMEKTEIEGEKKKTFIGIEKLKIIFNGRLQVGVKMMNATCNVHLSLFTCICKRSSSVSTDKLWH